MTARALRLLLFLSMLATMSVAPAVAQTTLGRVVGIVRDSTGAVMPGAAIVLESRATGEALETTSQSDGAFIFPQVRPGYYTVKVELAGFKPVTYNDVKVDPGQEYSLSASLDVGGLNEAVQVTAGIDLVHTTTPEVTNTVRQEQILELPLNARNPIELIRLQAGVPGVAARQNTAINGGRPTWTQTTQDGINIQDNFIRVNALDFVPNRPTSDIVGEFTIVTATQGADAAGGATQVRMITPSGTNEYHGSIYEFNRHSKFSANSWFNNRDKLPKPYLNRNQWGGRAGGPIKKGKLFFFGYYEKFTQSQQATPNNQIPLNDDYLTGTFRYRSPGSTDVRSVNVLQLSGLSLDSAVQQRITSQIRRAADVNNSDVGDGLNRGGYRFNQEDITTRHYVGGRGDFNFSAAHQFEGTFTRLSDVDDRTDLDTIHEKPLVYTSSVTKFMVGAWRWTATSRLQNEFRAGANLAPVAFESDEDFGDTIFNMPNANGVAALTNPIATFQPQGRDTRTFQFIDTATYVTGDHTLQFGGSFQRAKVKPYNYAARFPAVTFGFSAAAPTSAQLTTAMFPGGIAPADLTSANNHLAFLAGAVSTVTQTLQVRDRTSGYVPGIPDERNFTLDNTNIYIQDNWRLRPGLTIRGGVKWEYYSPLKEDNDLLLLPVQAGGQSTFDALMNPNGTVDFVSGGLYGADRNNLGPTIGFAWDPSQNGRTAVRGGYSLTFVNEDTMTVARNAAINNSGLSTAITLANQYKLLATGAPAIASPAFVVPRTYAQQLGLALGSAAFSVDSEITQPRVHQFTLGVEREVGFDMAVEARYVGTLGRGIWRGVDYNQVSSQGAFLADFLRARQNGFLAQAATGTFDPAYNAGIAGSQPLTFIPQFGGGSLTNATVRTNIQTGQAGALADFYLLSAGAAVAATARQAFFQNPGIYAADNIINGGSTDYHALQLETRRRFKNGLFWQANYTFAKSLSDTAGTAQARFEPFLDNARPGIERTRSEFHVTHVMNANVIYELPFGEGHKWLDRPGILNALVGGWQLSSIVHLQSGAPFSILAARGTFNRAGRSAGNMAVTDLSRDEIQALVGIYKQPDGRVYFIDPKIIDPGTGRGVGTDTLANGATFPGQVFFNPTAGELGTLQRLSLDSPSLFTVDLSLSKKQRIGSRYSAEFKFEAFNVTNTPIFDFADTDINSQTFGRVTQYEPNATGSRVVQLAVKFNF
jgi:hypothetical protein